MSEDPVTSTGGTENPASPGQEDRSVGALELFFDLVFVYAMSQVTNLMLGDISWLGFGRGALSLAAIWWAWVCFVWLAGGLVDFGGPIISGMQGWHVLPSCFIERHGNVIIIALGEAIVQVGATADGDATKPWLLAGVALGVLICAGLWGPTSAVSAPTRSGGCSAPEVCGKLSWPVTPTATFTCRSSASSSSRSGCTRRSRAPTSRSRR